MVSVKYKATGIILKSHSSPRQNKGLSGKGLVIQLGWLGKAFPPRRKYLAARITSEGHHGRSKSIKKRI